MTLPESPAVPARASGASAVLLFVVFALAFAAQGGTLRNGFVWDDAVVVRQDARLDAGLAALPDLLASPWGGEAQDVGLHRPLVSATFAIQSAVHGHADPLPYHLVNLLLHATVAAMLCAAIARRMPGRPAVAAGAALLFAVHPLHTGTVSWIVARGDTLAAVFGLLALARYGRRAGAPGFLDVALTCTYLTLATLAKESAVVFPLALFLLDAGRRREGPLTALARRPLATVALVLPVALWYAIRVASVGGLEATSIHGALAHRDLGTRLVIGAGALVRTAARLIAPVGLTGDASGDPVLSARAAVPTAYVVSAVLVVGVGIGAAWRGLRGRAGPVVAALGLFVVLSIPVLQAFPIGAVFEDRYAYVPSLAFLLLGGLALERLLAASPRAVGGTLAVVTLVALAAASQAAAATWRDERAFDEALLARDAGHSRALVRLGLATAAESRAAWARADATPMTTPESQATVFTLRDRSRALASEATVLLERARSLPGGASPSVLRALGDVYRTVPSTRFEAAEEAYVEWLKRKRVRVDGRKVPLVQVDREMRERVVRADRDDVAQVLSSRGVVRKHLGDPEAAAARYGEAADWAPWDRELQRVAAAAHVQAQLFGAALAYYRRSVRLASEAERASAVREYGEAAERAIAGARDEYDRGRAELDRPGGQRDAVRAFEEAARLHPGFVTALVAAARVRGDSLGNLRDAIRGLDAAKAILADRAGLPSGEDDATLTAEVERLLARYHADWGK